ncbi:hypothetical protein DLJ49_01350 [Rhodovulum sp. 12E13]|nr:hypothetical protein DLJ49_01350 [Rhodovulum sp. 12E13]
MARAMSMRLRLALLPLVALPLAALAQEADPGPERVGPRLAAASNFGQGWLPGLAEAALADGLTDFRDAVYWRNVERGGHVAFDSAVTAWPDAVAADGGTLSLTVNNGHPEHDGGHTPHTDAGIAAFAANAAATVARFPNIHTVEVGNEWNAANFVSGPVLEDGLDRRAWHHMRLLAETSARVRAVRPGLRVLGGATHSIPGPYIAELLALGARRHMDALAIHPYTTPVEQLGPHIDFLRRLPGAEGIDLEVTEFGHAGSDADAADHLLRSWCQFALAGVSRAVWYPLHPRGDGLAALYTREGVRTVVGDAHALIRAELAGETVTDAAPDPFTHACALGPAEAPRHLVIWGAPRDVWLAPGLMARDATGAALPAEGLTLSDRALLISAPGDGAARLGDTVRLGSQRVLADSYEQYDFPREAGAQAPGDPFERYARAGARRIALDTRPGQDRNGVPWFPHRGAAEDAGLWMTSDTLVLARWGDTPLEIVHRHVAPAPVEAVLEARLAPVARSEDGVTVRIAVDGGPVLVDETLREERVYALPVRLAEGAALEIAVGPGGTARGDVVGYRFTLRRP